MDELIPKTPEKPGRRQTLTAKAWISRVNRRGRFFSHVSLGKGETSRRATETVDRAKALDFNRAHLLELLMKPKATAGTRAASVEQLSLITDR